MNLTLPQLRRLDELVEDWAVWHCDRHADRPALETAGIWRNVAETKRAWLSVSEQMEDALRSTNDLVDTAIDELPAEMARTLQAWAWENFYNRRIVAEVRKREAIERERQVYRSNRRGADGNRLVTEESVEAAKLALVPRLRAHGIDLG